MDLWSAALEGRVGDVERILLEENKKKKDVDYCDINALDKNGFSALHYATLQGHSDVVALLLSEGADVNCYNLSQETPLHLASRANNVDLIRLFLSLNCQVSRANLDGKTALDIAESHSVPCSVINLLRSASAWNEAEAEAADSELKRVCFS